MDRYGATAGGGTAAMRATDPRKSYYPVVSEGRRMDASSLSSGSTASHHSGSRNSYRQEQTARYPDPTDLYFANPRGFDGSTPIDPYVTANRDVPNRPYSDAALGTGAARPRPYTDVDSRPNRDNYAKAATGYPGRMGIDRQPMDFPPYATGADKYPPSSDSAAARYSTGPGYPAGPPPGGHTVFQPQHDRNRYRSGIEPSEIDRYDYRRPIEYTESGRYGYDRPVEHNGLLFQEPPHRDPWRESQVNPYDPRSDSEAEGLRYDPDPLGFDPRHRDRLDPREVDSRIIPLSGPDDPRLRPQEYQGFQNDDDFQRGGAHRHRREGAGQDEFGRRCRR